MTPEAAVGYLGLGSNLGDRRSQLEAAARSLDEATGMRVLASSSVYETEPVGEVTAQPPFQNACLRISTALEPEALLDVGQALERRLGREPGGERHAPRPIDVDVLLLGGRVHASPRLEIPHPALLERRFVLIGLLELDFEARTPAGVSLAEALAGLPLEGQDVRYAGPPLLGHPAPGTDPGGHPAPGAHAGRL